jgi:hypothetical protein
MKVWVHVSAGYRLPPPEGCPKGMADLMSSCWHGTPEERPTFSSIVQTLEHLLRQDHGYQDEASGGYLTVGATNVEPPKPKSWVKQFTSKMNKNAPPSYDMGSSQHNYEYGHAGPVVETEVDASQYGLADDDAARDAIDNSQYGLADDEASRAQAEEEFVPVAIDTSMYGLADDDAARTAQAEEEDENVAVAIDSSLYGLADDDAASAAKPRRVSGMSAMFESGNIDTSMYGLAEDDAAGSGGVDTSMYGLADDGAAVGQRESFGFGSDAETARLLGSHSRESPTEWTTLNDSQASEAVTGLNESYDNTDEVARLVQEATNGIGQQHVGRRVKVEGYQCEGTLRFFGIHHSKGQPRCGVELDKPDGKNNGTVSGHTYFSCKSKHGVLVVPRKVTLLE